MPVTGRFQRRHMSAENRWIILTPDGGHVSVGRHTDPSDDEIEAAAGKLRQAGTGGWLAVMEGHYYRPRESVSVMMVRQLAPTGASWEAAVDAFQTACRRAIVPARPKAPGPG